MDGIKSDLKMRQDVRQPDVIFAAENARLGSI
jgi:hypothetical protein